MDREKKFEELAGVKESMSIDERNFMLWLLLRDYASRLDIPKRIDTLDDYRKERFNHGLLVDCNKLIDILNFELWR